MNNPKLFTKEYQTAPESIKNVMGDEKTAEIIGSIGEKFKLDMEQQSTMASEVGYYMVGLLDPETFLPDLRGELKIDLQKARDIERELDAQIFDSVAEDLKKLHKGRVFRWKTEKEPSTPEEEKPPEKVEISVPKVIEPEKKPEKPVEEVPAEKEVTKKPTPDLSEKKVLSLEDLESIKLVKRPPSAMPEEKTETPKPPAETPRLPVEAPKPVTEKPSPQQDPYRESID